MKKAQKYTASTEFAPGDRVWPVRWEYAICRECGQMKADKLVPLKQAEVFTVEIHACILQTFVSYYCGENGTFDSNSVFDSALAARTHCLKVNARRTT